MEEARVVAEVRRQRRVEANCAFINPCLPARAQSMCICAPPPNKGLEPWMLGTHQYLKHQSKEQSMQLLPTVIEHVLAVDQYLEQD